MVPGLTGYPVRSLTTIRYVTYSPELRSPNRLLLVLLGVIAPIPVGTGLLGIVGGLAFGPGGDETVSYFDSEYRFLNVVRLC